MSPVVGPQRRSPELLRECPVKRPERTSCCNSRPSPSTICVAVLRLDDDNLGRYRAGMNKFVEPRPYADPEAAARKIMEIAHGLGEVWDGRIFTEN